MADDVLELKPEERNQGLRVFKEVKFRDGTLQAVLVFTAMQVIIGSNKCR